jgi:aldose sugar dehydrogenase
VTDRVDIITDIPFKNNATAAGDPGAHSGGRIRFSPYDGFLYMCAALPCTLYSYPHRA